MNAPDPHVRQLAGRLRGAAGWRQSGANEMAPLCRAGHKRGHNPSADQLTRATSTRLSEKVGARPSPDQASDEIELTEPSERLSERQ